MADASTTPDETTASWKFSVVVSLVILAVASGIVYLTFTTEPTAEKGGAAKRTAMLVEVTEADQGTYRPRIVAQGTVQPAKDVELRPQVGGRVVSLAEGFVPGGFVEEGELMMRIEAADYRHALAQRKSELRQAKSDLAVEKGRRDAAKAEYGRFGEQLQPENESLVLRQPQLEAAQERVDAAQAAVDQAQLNVQRTTVEAPFDAHIVRRDINTGSQVSPNDTIARLVGTDTYWVGVELPLSKLRWVEVAGGEGDGSEVLVRNEQAWPEGSVREGHLFKKVGMLDEDTRMARVLAAVPDPLARETDEASTPELVIGEFVEVTVKGKPLDGVVRLNRDYVRADDTVWVMKDGKLKIHDVEIVVRDPDYAYISEGLSGGAKVVTTNLSTVEDGAALRLNSADEGQTDDEEGGGE